MLSLIALLLTAAPDAGRPTPYSFDRAITAADLQGKSLRELSLIRNVVFARAGQVFRKSWVREYFSQFDWYKPTGLDPKKLSALDKANAATVAKFEIAISVEELTVRREWLSKQVQSAKTPAKDDVIELFLLSEAMGVSPPAFLSSLAPSHDRDPLARPEVLDALLTVSQLKDLSKRDLRILRNTVFARRGREFKTETMHDYFAKKEWYRVDPAYTDKRLTKIDLVNIKLIRSVEESLGGPEVEPGSEPPDGFMMAA